MIRLEKDDDSDWYVLRGGGNWASVEGPRDEWVAIAAAIDEWAALAGAVAWNTVLSYRRCAVEFTMRGLRFWSPRNACSPEDCIAVPEDDVSRLVANIRAVTNSATGKNRKAELLAALAALEGLNQLDAERAHARADELLVQYIDDVEIAAAFEKVRKWYA